MKLLIDADILVYNCAYAAQTPVNWGSGIWTLHGDEKKAYAFLTDFVEKLKVKLNASSAVLVLSSESNWRKFVLPSYKSNRSHADVGVLVSRAPNRPILYAPLRNSLLKDEAVMVDYLEGDDVLGLLATDPEYALGFTADPEPSIICSSDKDMLTIPGTLYNWETNRTRQITLDEADRNHLTQALTGDRVDCYVGCPGIGKVTAAKLFVNVPTQELWPVIVGAYAKAGLTEEEALIQARVARILRYGEHESGVVWLWHPDEVKTRLSYPLADEATARNDEEGIQHADKKG